MMPSKIRRAQTQLRAGRSSDSVPCDPADKIQAPGLDHGRPKPSPITAQPIRTCSLLSPPMCPESHSSHHHFSLRLRQLGSPFLSLTVIPRTAVSAAATGAVQVLTGPFRTSWLSSLQPHPYYFWPHRLLPAPPHFRYTFRSTGCVPAVPFIQNTLPFYTCQVSAGASLPAGLAPSGGTDSRVRAHVPLPACPQLHHLIASFPPHTSGLYHSPHYRITRR